MTTTYSFFADLATEAPIPARGILSQTLSNEGDIEFLLFSTSHSTMAGPTRSLSLSGPEARSQPHMPLRLWARAPRSSSTSPGTSCHNEANAALSGHRVRSSAQPARRVDVRSVSG